jgi:hypothetical protein
MWWIVGGAVVLGGGGVAAMGVWVLGPTLRTFFRPEFEPASRDDESIYRAQSSGDSRGGGAGQ